MVVDNQAWIGGVITNGSATGEYVTGRRVLTTVVDNGKSANDPPDEISFSYDYDAINSPVRCTDKEELPLQLLPMTDGQVTVN